MQRKIIYTFEFVFFIFIALLKFIFIDKYSKIYELITIIFFVISLIVLLKLLGYKKDNNICRSNATQIVIISILLYILITYLSGLFFGFLRNSYSLNIKSIVNNTYMLIIVIIIEEIIRYIVANQIKKNKYPLIILTVLYILLDIVFAYNANIINTGLKLFIFVSSVCLSSAARNILCSYITFKVSYIPSLIIRLFFGIYVYFVPIEPDLGDYLNSVIGVVYPYLVYLFISKLVRYSEHDKPSPINRKLWYLNIPIAFATLFLIILVSGIFKYQIMAIGSGSMEPIIYRGDAVIFKKVNNTEELKVGDILVFKNNNKFITHRIVSIDENNNTITFTTKGDNNDDIDEFVTHEEDVIGVVRIKIKYIGLPTLWLQDLLG
jgi:signal peptidase I